MTSQPKVARKSKVVPVQPDMSVDVPMATSDGKARRIKKSISKTKALEVVKTELEKVLTPQETTSQSPLTTEDVVAPVKVRVSRIITVETIQKDFEELKALISSLPDSLGERKRAKVFNEIKTLENHVLRKLKVKRPHKEGYQSVFDRKNNISDELKQFFKLEDGTYSRNEVNRLIYDYVKPLQNPENKRQLIISGDKALCTLLGHNEPIRYCDIQTHLKRHYLGLVPVPKLEVIEKSELESPSGTESDDTSNDNESESD